MNELEQARQDIDDIDREMARLFEKRMRCSGRIAEYKRQNGLPIRAPAREAALMTRNLRYLEEPSFAAYYEKFLREIIELSCRYQEELTSARQAETGGQV